MKKLQVIVLINLLIFSNIVQAAEDKFVSVTFQDILNRVIGRDKESGAILEIKVKEDSPQLNFGLSFNIEEVPNQNEVIIILYRNLKAGDGVYEKYRLRIDDAICRELENQKYFYQLQTEHKKKFQENLTKKITELTKGVLEYGIPCSKVQTIKGKAISILASAAAAGNFTWVYPDIKLHFVGGTLQDVELIKD
ncbi:MAG: hypothetical protein FD167_562 [bacterium]|nr:MAG: hypothetical protein FD167_562 [bacterium]